MHRPRWLYSEENAPVLESGNGLIRWILLVLKTFDWFRILCQVHCTDFRCNVKFVLYQFELFNGWEWKKWITSSQAERLSEIRNYCIYILHSCSADGLKCKWKLPWWKCIDYQIFYNLFASANFYLVLVMYDFYWSGKEKVKYFRQTFCLCIGVLWKRK